MRSFFLQLPYRCLYIVYEKSKSWLIIQYLMQENTTKMQWKQNYVFKNKSSLDYLVLMYYNCSLCSMCILVLLYKTKPYAFITTSIFYSLNWQITNAYIVFVKKLRGTPHYIYNTVFFPGLHSSWLRLYSTEINRITRSSG